MKSTKAFAILILLLIAGSVNAQSSRVIKKEVVVNAPLQEVWNTWTTSEGVETFFAPKANIQLESGGAYEVLFAPNAPKGRRGCEGCKVLSFEPMRTLSIDWGVPPMFPALQNQRGTITLTFEPVDSAHVRVVVVHSGLGSGGDWDKVYEHFDQGWSIVLARLQQRFKSGPMDWQSLAASAGR
ncbi:MAG TPA: SRPBCC domain-containing protein [Blastocatellia bacterium]|nr:SRPBCC domain-containing protein [Blastocatellia bacterium]